MDYQEWRGKLLVELKLYGVEIPHEGEMRYLYRRKLSVNEAYDAICDLNNGFHIKHSATANKEQGHA